MLPLCLHCGNPEPFPLGLAQLLHILKGVKTVKAVVTAAGRAQRHLPLQSVVDRGGMPRSACELFVEELASAGIEEIAFIICPGDEPLYREALSESRTKVHFIEQTEPRGYGHAVLCAKDFIGNDPFLLTVGDHLYLADHDEASCTHQLLQHARTRGAPVSAVQGTHESKLAYFGAVGGRPLADAPQLLEIQTVREKPTPTDAEQELIVPGQRPGYYYCFFGMHVLPSAILKILEQQFAVMPSGQILQLSPALETLAHRIQYLAAVLKGRRYDLGQPYGLLTAQLALALDGPDREAVLANLVELLAQTKS
jgi:UTP--glucose-1-phosphate uridylyltransferase